MINICFFNKISDVTAVVLIFPVTPDQTNITWQTLLERQRGVMQAHELKLEPPIQQNSWTFTRLVPFGKHTRCGLFYEEHPFQNHQLLESTFFHCLCV